MYQFFSALCWCTYLHLASTCSLLRSDDVPTVPSSDSYLPSFAFWWYSYPFLSSYCPLCILMYLQYLPLTSTCPLLRSADVHALFRLLLSPFCILVMYLPTVPSFNFYLPSFAFCWCTYPCFSSVFPHYLPENHTLNPACKTFLAQWWRTYTLVPSYWPPIHPVSAEYFLIRRLVKAGLGLFDLDYFHY